MSPINYRLFRRQFYIGPHVKSVDEAWQSHCLSGGLVLSYCQTLPFKTITDQAGQQWVLLGDAIQSLKGLPSPGEQIQKLTSKDNVQAIYTSWAGRWVLIGNDQLHLDAVGLLGCYYRLHNDILEITTSPSLIYEGKDPDTFVLKSPAGIEWYPLPDSGFQQLSKLLPSQILNIKTGQLQFRSLHCAFPELSYQECVIYLSDLLTTTLENLFKQTHKKALLGLTAGYDSRTLMAVLNHLKLPYETLTFHWPLLHPADLNIPKQLAQLSTKKHLVLKRQKLKQVNADTYNLHTTCHAIEKDRDFMKYQQFNVLDAEDYILLRGGGFEVSAFIYARFFPAELPTGEAIAQRLKGNAWQGQSINKWLNWVRQTPEIRWDWRDRFFWEQRLAGWLSSTEQGLDLVNMSRMVPANSFLFYNVMLSLPVEIRKNKTQQVDMIRHLAPELLQPPFNPQLPPFQQRLRKLLLRTDKILKRLTN